MILHSSWIRAKHWLVLALFTLHGCNSIPVQTVDEIKNHPKVQVETIVVNMGFDEFVDKLEIEQRVPPLSTVSWAMGGQPVYVLQKISNTEARFIGVGHGSLYGLFEIIPTQDGATQVTSYDFGAHPTWQTHHKDVLSTW